MAERIVQVASISWLDDETGEAHLGLRRNTVETDTMSERDLARFEEHGAFAPEGTDPDDLPGNGEIDADADTAAMSDEELLAWVAAANVDTVVAAAGENPDEAQRLLDAEYEVADGMNRDPRKGIENGIEAVLKSQG